MDVAYKVIDKVIIWQTVLKSYKKPTENYWKISDPAKTND